MRGQKKPGGRCILSISITPEQLEKIQDAAAVMNKSVSVLMRDAADEYIDRITEAIKAYETMKGEF